MPFAFLYNLLSAQGPHAKKVFFRNGRNGRISRNDGQGEVKRVVIRTSLPPVIPTTTTYDAHIAGPICRPRPPLSSSITNKTSSPVRDQQQEPGESRKAATAPRTQLLSRRPRRTRLSRRVRLIVVGRHAKRPSRGQVVGWQAILFPAFL
jgi:hypothetical protein